MTHVRIVTALAVMACASPAYAAELDADPRRPVLRDLLEATSKLSPASGLQPRRTTRTVTIPELHWAAIEGDAARVRSLLAGGASVHAKDSLDGATALHWAADGGHRSTVRALLDGGARLEETDDRGLTPLFWAAAAGGQELLALTELLAAGADPNAAAGDNGSALAGMTPLHSTVARKDSASDAITLLRRFGANANTPVGVGVQGLTPIHLAVLAPSLLGKGFVDLTVIAALTETSSTILGQAASPNGLGQAASPNARDNDGFTPMHYAVLPNGSGAILVLLALIAAGGDVNATANDGTSVLDAARATHGVFSPLVDFLSSRGAR